MEYLAGGNSYCVKYPRMGSTVIKKLPFVYFHLSLITNGPLLEKSMLAEAAIDMITARTNLDSALQQYLGLSGTAIPIDLLKVEGRDVWIRLPREDGSAVQGCLSQWTGRDGSVTWRIKAKANVLGQLAAGDGRAHFAP